MGVTYELLHEESGEYIDLGKTLMKKIDGRYRTVGFQGLVAIDVPDGERFVRAAKAIERFLVDHSGDHCQTFRLLADCEESALDWAERTGVEVMEVSEEYAYLKRNSG